MAKLSAIRCVEGACTSTSWRLSTRCASAGRGPAPCCSRMTRDWARAPPSSPLFSPCGAPFSLLPPCLPPLLHIALQAKSVIVPRVHECFPARQ